MIYILVAKWDISVHAPFTGNIWTHNAFTKFTNIIMTSISSNYD